MVVVVCLLVFGLYQYDKKTVQDWAATNHYNIKDMTMKWTPFGTPFYYVHKGEYIFKVEMENHDVWWVRTNRWSGNDYIKEK